MSSMSRSHQSLPAAGLGTGRTAEGGQLGIPDPICQWLPQVQALLATLLPGEVSLVSFLLGRLQPWLVSALNLTQHHPLLVQPLLEGLICCTRVMVLEPGELDRSRDGHQVQRRVQLIT